MLKIYIPGMSSLPVKRQFPITGKYVVGNCEFFFDEQVDYDYLVVLDSLSNIVCTSVPKNRRVLFLGEPPFVKFYNSKFYKQFGHVFGCQSKLVKNGISKKMNPVLPWMAGCSLKVNSHSFNGGSVLTYNDFKTMKANHSLNKACLITSDKTFTKGHRDRVNFANYILKSNIDYIDVYGNGFQPIPDKFEVLSKYKYSIIIENCSYPDYWTEKLADCYLSESYPIYYGATNIADYFNKEAFSCININDHEKALSIVKTVIENDFYDKKFLYLEQAKDLVLNKYNMFFMIADVVEQIDKANGEYKAGEVVDIAPMKYNFFDKIHKFMLWNVPF